MKVLLHFKALTLYVYDFTNEKCAVSPLNDVVFACESITSGSNWYRFIQTKCICLNMFTVN